jgi:acyl-CoA synthetase (AMP-forming)/AMP-acid ligase II
MSMAETLVELVQERVLANPDRVVYRMLREGTVEAGTLTYAQLDAEARRIAALLLAVLRPGAPALLCHPPGLEYIASFFGCLYAGVTPVPVYPPRANASLERLEAIVEDVGPGAALLPDAAHAALASRIASHPVLSRLCWVSTTPSGTPGSAPSLPRVRSGDLALLQYTSGSTSQPKGVMLSHANLLANLRVIRDKFHCADSDHGIFWLPPYHDMGLIGGLLQAPFANLVTTLMSPYAFLQRPVRWLQAISKYGGTISGAPNFAFEYCLRRLTEPDLVRLDLSTWRLAFCGAEPVDPRVLSRFSEALAPAGSCRLRVGQRGGPAPRRGDR